MRNNKKRGFTLVELLVVIAILAILATVSVVGYTSYIQGSAVRVDADLATQLNHFLAAYQVEHPEKITEDNIDEVVADLLELGGIDALDPQAANYGYHFYYDFKNEEFASIHDDQAIEGLAPAAQIAMNVFGYEPANGTSYKVRPGNCFTYNGQYYLVDGVGELAEVVSGIVNFKGTATDLTNLEKAAQDTGYEALAEFVNSTVFVTKNGSLVVSTSGSRSYVIIADDVETIKNEIVDVTGTKLTLSDTTYLATTADGFSMYVPETVTYIEGNALNINTPEDCTILYLPAGTDVTAVCEAGFTNPNVIIMVGNVRYKLTNSSSLVNTETNMTTTLKIKSVVTNFDLVINDTNNDNIDTYQQEGYSNNIGYVAWNNGNFLVQVDTSQVWSTDDTNKASTYEMYWEIVTEGLDDYIYISNGEDGNPAGTVVFKNADYTAFLAHLNTLADEEGKTYFTVKATSVYSVTTNDANEQIIEKVEDGNYANCPYVTMDVRILTIASVGEVKIKGAANGWTSTNPVVLPYTEIGQTFDIVASELKYNWDGETFNVDLACSVALTYECLHKTEACYGNCSHVSGGSHLDANGKTYTESECFKCPHKEGTHDDTCCTHENNEVANSQVTIEVAKSEYAQSWKIKMYVKSYTCSMCPNAGVAGHWCYKQVTGFESPYQYGYINSKNYYTGELWEVNSECSLSCQKTSTSDKFVEHTTHNQYCCSHYLDNTAHTDACYTCLHNGEHTEVCLNCVHTTLGNSIISGNVITIPTDTDINLNKLSGKLSVSVEGEDWGYVNLTFANFSESDFKPSSSLSTYQNVYVGKQNSIKVSDLFEFVGENFNAAVGYKLVIYTADVDKNNYDNLSYGNESERVEFVIESVDQVIDLTSLAVSSVKPYRAVVFMNGTRITDDMILKVVDATNVHTWEEFKALVDTTATDEKGVLTNALKESVVLFGDIAIPADDDVNFFTLISKAIYGNCFTFDVKNGRTANDIICIEGTAILRDLKLKGEVYTDFALQKTDEWGSSVVRAEGNSSIINCYISNTRSPLYVGGTKVTVEDSVLYGGRFANVDHRGGELVFEGTVTLIQKPIDISFDVAGNEIVYNKVLGFGIATWFNDGAAKVVTLETDAKLIQYNFVSEDMKSYLPTIAGIVTFTEPFNEVFNNPEYQSYIYKDGDTKYINSGIVATDAYRIDYCVETSRAADSKEYKEGDILVLKLDGSTKTEVGKNNTDEFTITFLPDYFEPVDYEADGNLLKVTGGDLYNGVSFKVTQDITLEKLELDLGSLQFNEVQDWLIYSFRIDCPDHYKNLETSNNIKYQGFIFDSETDYTNIFALTGQTFHDVGLHYGRIVMDVRTPVGYTDQFEQYLTYVMDGAYDPDGENAYDFVNGELVIYDVTDVE